MFRCSLFLNAVYDIYRKILEYFLGLLDFHGFFTIFRMFFFSHRQHLKISKVINNCLL
jgi:hypothetical protein